MARPYTPTKVEEGAILEAQYGIEKGPYTQLWEHEKRNQAPQTHIHYPSAEQKHYEDVKKAFNVWENQNLTL